MWRGTGRYQGQLVRLDSPMAISDGTEVEVIVRITMPSPEAEDAQFQDLGMARLEDTWDNEDDAVYDNWRSLYGL